MEGQGHKGHGMNGTCTTWLARTSGRRKWLLRRNTWRRLDLSTRWQGGGGSPRDLLWPGAVVRHGAELVTPWCGGGGASIWWEIPLAEKNRWEEVQASVSTWNILRQATGWLWELCSERGKLQWTHIHVVTVVWIQANLEIRSKSIGEIRNRRKPRQLFHIRQYKSN